MVACCRCDGKLVLTATTMQEKHLSLDSIFINYHTFPMQIYCFISCWFISCNYTDSWCSHIFFQVLELSSDTTLSCPRYLDVLWECEALFFFLSFINYELYLRFMFNFGLLHRSRPSTFFHIALMTYPWRLLVDPFLPVPVNPIASSWSTLNWIHGSSQPLTIQLFESPSTNQLTQPNLTYLHPKWIIGLLQGLLTLLWVVDPLTWQVVRSSRLTSFPSVHVHPTMTSSDIIHHVTLPCVFPSVHHMSPPLIIGMSLVMSTSFAVRSPHLIHLIHLSFIGTVWTGKLTFDHSTFHYLNVQPPSLNSSAHLTRVSSLDPNSLSLSWLFKVFSFGS